MVTVGRLRTQGGYEMPLSRRYTPEHPPGEECNFGLHFSLVIPPGVGGEAARSPF